MLENIQLSNVLFLDLETVSGAARFSDLSPRLQTHWRKKCRFILRMPAGEEPSEEQVQLAFEDKAAIYAEFGKIVCISIGYIHNVTKDLRLKSYCDTNEKKLLQDFVQLIDRHFPDPAKNSICGHNIREFDIPYLCRRLLINDIELPPIFRLAGKKPWETKHLIDTMTLWKFGDIKNFTSLDLLATVFDVQTPKDDIDGSMVGKVFWDQNDLTRIASYCEKDVVTVVQVLRKMKGMPLLDPAHIVTV